VFKIQLLIVYVTRNTRFWPLHVRYVYYKRLRLILYYCFERF